MVNAISGTGSVQGILRPGDADITPGGRGARPEARG